MENKEKEFDLGTVLSITTGRLFTDLDNVYSALNYLTGDNIYTHQIARVVKVAGPYVLSKYPQLEGVGSDLVVNSEEDVITFLKEQKKIYGNKFALTPMTKEDGYSYVDPIEEIVQIKSKKR